MEEKFMRAALKKAMAGVLRGQTPFGACIVKDGRIVSCAHNTVWRDNDVTAHAEVNAIREACRKLKTIDLSGCVLYSTCEPCPMCYGAIHWAGIKKIVYGTCIQDARKAGFNELCIPDKKMGELGKSRIKLAGSVMRKETMDLINRWSRRKNKRTY